MSSSVTPAGFASPSARVGVSTSSSPSTGTAFSDLLSGTGADRNQSPASPDTPTRTAVLPHASWHAFDSASDGSDNTSLDSEDNPKGRPGGENGPSAAHHGEHGPGKTDAHRNGEKRDSGKHKNTGDGTGAIPTSIAQMLLGQPAQQTADSGDDADGNPASPAGGNVTSASAEIASTAAAIRAQSMVREGKTANAPHPAANIMRTDAGAHPAAATDDDTSKQTTAAPLNDAAQNGQSASSSFSSPSQGSWMAGVSRVSSVAPSSAGPSTQDIDDLEGMGSTEGESSSLPGDRPSSAARDAGGNAASLSASGRAANRQEGSRENASTASAALPFHHDAQGKSDISSIGAGGAPFLSGTTLGQSGNSLLKAIENTPSWTAYMTQATSALGNPIAPVQSLSIALQPAELGSVTATLHLSGGQLRIDVEVQTDEARQRLSSDADQIVKSLQSLGFDVSHVTVRQTVNGVTAPQAANVAGQTMNQTPSSASGHSGRGSGGGTSKNSGRANGEGNFQAGAIQPQADGRTARGLFI